MGKSSRIQIEDEVFDSLKEAADFLGINDYDLSGKLDDCEEKVIKGFKVRRLDPRVSRFCGAIYCNRTGKLYKNAVILGKCLKVNPTYISNELRKNNKYVDRFNNTYRRVQNPENFDMSKAIDSVEPITLHAVSLVETQKPVVQNEPSTYIEPTPVTKTEVKESVVEDDSDILNDLEKLTVRFLNKRDYSTVEGLLDVMKKITSEKTNIA